ncbi:SusC/RagA family TonB-linked outer membrane protein [Flavitalea sp. BT771]|uniref:SusC/RagA family TonB-linked outer membrane protein n=1 Tax=Flavitalea sp. BT771 TaxID=3063329 RepID=UPI0026E2EC2E|nr:SusC/RagA family TonB-linked outer membrane protein [Flavitalea sp. BT771]MDO6431354.1 SusC/RagA family TonB-linked outer membrane protein [Flavitalea sp. BT771]MDV6220262.1 SusC/RagA family TonB-linked outer membrane protein [Flavitalea sp. BT771]
MRKLLVLCAVPLLVALNAISQNLITVKGTIKAENGQPIANVSIRVKGTNKGTTTNEKGDFTLTTAAQSTLEISAINYSPQEIKLAGRTSLALTMQESNSSLGETVIIGYQRVTRKKSTAAISSISGKEIENLPSSSFDQLMQGRLSGVNVQNFSGEPGARPTVSVRGNSLVSRDYDQNNVVNNPLYVVDGVPQPNEEYVGPGTTTGMNYLGGVNPNDIESIDVLKDASAAAIYGSRAANGVILITTKKGRVGAPRVLISGYTGVTERPKLREVTLGTLERRQKMEVLMQQLDYTQRTQLPYLLTDSLNPAFNGNTDWQGLFYKTGLIRNGDLSMSGGSDNSNYRFSAGYYDEDGIIKATGFKRYSMRLNLLTKTLHNKLDINPIIAYSRTDKARGNGQDPRYTNNYNPFSLSAGSMPSSLFGLDANKQQAILGAYNNNLDKNVANNLNFNLNLGYTFNPHLRFQSLTGYLYNTSRRDFTRSNAMESQQGNYSYTFSDNQIDIQISNYLTYTNSFGKHNLSLLGGQDIQYDQYENTTASGSNGASDQIQVVNGFRQSTIRASSDYQAYGLLSYYARLAYDYDSKYLLSFSARRDGSSRFGQNSKWGFFPSASVAWILSDEKIMKNSYFSLLKLRASLGTSGSLPKQNYLQYNLYNVNAAAFNGNNSSTSSASSYNSIAAITPNFHDGVAQKGLSWEKSMQWNIGTDMEIDQGRFGAQIDFYNKESSLQLFSVNLPVTTGYDIALTNSIGVRNAGVELLLKAYPLPKSSPVKWFTSFNISYNKNRIMSLPNGGRDLIFQNGDRFDKSHILSVGRPINSFYLYQTLGVFATDADVPIDKFTGARYRNGNGPYKAGDFYLADLDHDNFIDIFNSNLNPDKMPIGDPNPKFTGGWTNNFTWKNWNLGVFFAFTFKRDVLNLYKADQFNNSTDGNANENFAQYSIPNLDKINIWRKPGDKAEFAKYDLGTYLYYYTSAQTFFLTSGDYFRLKSLSLTYQLPNNLLHKIGLERVKVFGVADNLLRWQSSKDLPDAENVNAYGEYDGAGYPIPKKFTLGLEVQF